MATRIDFCTYFDARYLARGLALSESLRRHAPRSRLHALCLDDPAYAAIERPAPPGVCPIRLADFEKDDDALLAAKRNRTLVEYYFTCTPSLPLYILQRNADIERLFYVDADCYFFSSPEAMIKEMGRGSIYLAGHRYAPDLLATDTYRAYPAGKYNVGILGFCNDREGLCCLQNWRSQCLDWCYYRVEEGNFADQKYLDRWPERYGGVVVSRHPGINLAPWNKANCSLDCRRGVPHVDGQPVVVYHFHSVRLYPFGVAEPQAADYGMALDTDWLQLIYKPYLMHLVQAGRQLVLMEGRDARSRGMLQLIKTLTRPGATQCLLRVGKDWVEIPQRLLAPLRLTRRTLVTLLGPFRRELAMRKL
jgi:hypothetical protein